MILAGCYGPHALGLGAKRSRLEAHLFSETHAHARKFQAHLTVEPLLLSFALPFPSPHELQEEEAEFESLIILHNGAQWTNPGALLFVIL